MFGIGWVLWEREGKGWEGEVPIKTPPARILRLCML